jgi:hypothetical protein
MKTRAASHGTGRARRNGCAVAFSLVAGLACGSAPEAVLGSTCNSTACDDGGASPQDPATPTGLPDVAAAPTSVPCNPLSEWERPSVDAPGGVPEISPARVELHGVTDEGIKMVLVGAAAPGDGELRLFVGRGDHLKEQAITSLEHRVDVAPDWRFQFELEGELAVVDSEALHPEHNEQMALSRATLTVGDTDNDLWSLSRTPMGLAGLSFECSTLSADGWTLSNTPPRQLTAGTCAPESPRPFRCFRFIDSDYQTGQTEGSATAVFRARVADTGTGLPPFSLVDSCRSEAEAALQATPDLSLVWTSFERNGARGLIVLRSLGAPSPFVPNMEIDVSYRFRGHTEETYTVRDSSGELLLWWSRSGGLDTLENPPEVTLSQGPERCATTGACAYASQYALELGLRGQTVLLDYGAKAQQAGFFAINAGYKVETTSMECFDAVPDGLNVELWATPASE